MSKLRALAAYLVMAATLGSGLAGCSPAPAGTAETNTSNGPFGDITVFAAASLQAPFTQLASDFEDSHPGTRINLNFAGSSDLVTQIAAGAPADVFASADAKNMAKLSDAGLVAGSAADFASNTLEIAVPPSNPASIASFADLARPGLNVVICAPQVPCGAATKAVEDAAKTTLRPVSEESSVTDVLGKVTSGQADAGLVYVTDVLAAGDKVKGISFPESDVAVNTYPIATVATSPNQQLANAFTATVTGPEGKKILTDAGFGTP